MSPISTLTSTAATPDQKLQLARLREAANGFERQFLEQLMKPAEPDEDDEDLLFGNTAATRQFTSMLNSELAGTGAGGLGIADNVVRELAAKAGLTFDQPKAKSLPESAP